MVNWIEEAVSSGARKSRACEVVGISIRTLQRWTEGGTVGADRRPAAVRPTPANRLSEAERQRIVEVSNEPAYASLPPSQIVPKLADQGVYIASESSFYRVLKAEGQLQHRGRARKPSPSRAPTTHVAHEPNAVWSWDVTWLPSRVGGRFWYLYLIEDIFSRKIVTWEVHASENGALAGELVQRAVVAERCFLRPLVLHADNGSPMKSQTLRAKLEELGITPSYSRPRVSNDNAYSESLFRTLKYCPSWPSQGFATLEAARQWVRRFVDWYNHRHCHSGLKFVTPAQRHRGDDRAILARRHAVYQAAKARRPERWSGKTRDWAPIGAVTLNPERMERIEAKAA